jgi:hypothetical protein
MFGSLEFRRMLLDRSRAEAIRERKNLEAAWERQNAE